MSNGFSLPEADNPHHLKEALCKVVRQEVEDAFGHRISTARDCIRLSEEIFSKTSIKVNPNTLRRFFGLVKAQYPPSLSTLRILASYCGYQSLDELSAVKKQKATGLAPYDEKNILYYLVNLFIALPVKEPIDETSYKLIKYTIQFLSHSPDLASKFQKAIAKTPQGQVYYYEQFVNIDQLNFYYGAGLRDYLREKKALEGQVLGHSLLCLKDWLSVDHVGLKRHYGAIQDLSPSKGVDAHISAHYINAQLLHANAFKLEADKILANAYKRYMELSRLPRQPYLYKSFEYTIVTILVLTCHCQEALFYINEAFLKYPESDNPMDQRCRTRLIFMRAVALAQSGFIVESEKIFEQLRPSQFCFLSKKTDTILYLLLASKLKRTNRKLEKQLDELIEDTGSIKLIKLWTNSRELVPAATICEQK